MRQLLAGLLMALAGLQLYAQPVKGALASLNDDRRGAERTQQYWTDGEAFICENGSNRYTRALYGGTTDYRIETSDRPIFAIVKKGQVKNVRFEVAGVPLDSTDYCWASYENGMRHYILQDRRLKQAGIEVLRIHVVAFHEEEGGIWQFIADHYSRGLEVKARVCDVVNSKLKRNGDLGVDDLRSFDPAPGDAGLVESMGSWTANFAHVVVKGDRVVKMGDIDAFERYCTATRFNSRMASRIVFNTPDPYINALGGALVMAADGAWDGTTWLHGCIGWRMPLAGWRAAYAGDVLGWPDRARSHFTAYAKSQVTGVAPTTPHPSQDAAQRMARAEKKWGTQMYSDGYICRTPGRNDQMHHYDMNLNYIDELLWHFQYDADLDYMRQMWPVIKRHLEWEKRNFDPDGDHLYDAYACIWASDALYYNGGAVTHSTAYNYRANLLAARIAELIGEEATPYRQEAAAILKAMNRRLWIGSQGHWAEYIDMMGLKRRHESAGVWSVYTPIDCGACSPEQAYRATLYVDREIPHLDVCADGLGKLQTIATTNWMPYAWSVNNVAPAEVMHTALAYFQAGRATEGFRLMKANVMDNMYFGQSPANFGQLSHLDAARGECYRDFGDCIGISSRTLIQGLFGVRPEALFGRCIIHPGFPIEWGGASLRTPYIEYKFTRDGDMDRYEITQHFSQPLKMVIRQNLGEGKFREVEGTAEYHQVITVPAPTRYVITSESQQTRDSADRLGLGDPVVRHHYLPWKKTMRKQDLSARFNASVTDVFKNEYRSPRPQVTTLQLPLQGVGEWCHPDYTPSIDDTAFRSLIRGDEIEVAGVPFRSPKAGRNIVFTSLWDNYPTSVTIPLKGKSHAAYLLMAGTTNHMQSRIDNGVVVVTYRDHSTDSLFLRNPDNWCPIEQDYFVDGQAFSVAEPRPYRISLGQGIVSRDLGSALGIEGVYGREIPGGAAQMLRMPLNGKKKLKSLTVKTLSNDVVIGLMAVTLE